MADVVSPEKRSRMMSGIKGKNTRPEVIIRKALHKRGFRYSLHHKNLPGKPDLVLPKYNAVVFINGCFWHAHDCHLFKWPSTRETFWREKIGSNKTRDLNNQAALRKQSWRMLLVWECAIKGKERISLEELIQHIAIWLISEEEFSSLRGVPKAQR